jgi:hypothetical protein
MTFKSIRFFEMLVALYRSTWCNNQEGLNCCCLVLKASDGDSAVFGCLNEPHN